MHMRGLMFLCENFSVVMNLFTAYDLFIEGRIFLRRLSYSDVPSTTRQKFKTTTTITYQLNQAGGNESPAFFQLELLEKFARKYIFKKNYYLIILVGGNTQRMAPNTLRLPWLFIKVNEDKFICIVIHLVMPAFVT